MMAEGVERMDALYARALSAGLFVHDRSLDTPLPPPPVEEEAPDVAKPETGPPVAMPLLISANDGTTLASALAQVRSVAGVQSVAEQGETGALVVTYRGPLSALRAALAGRGWSVDTSGGVLRISRSAAPPQPALTPTPTPQPGPPPPPAQQPPPAPTP
jgi:hypothetical protein